MQVRRQVWPLSRSIESAVAGGSRCEPAKSRSRNNAAFTDISIAVRPAIGATLDRAPTSDPPRLELPGLNTLRTGVEFPIGQRRTQFSSCRPGTRRKCRTFAVTIVAESASACAAFISSKSPIRWLFVFRTLATAHARQQRAFPRARFERNRQKRIHKSREIRRLRPSCHAIAKFSTGYGGDAPLRRRHLRASRRWTVALLFSAALTVSLSSR